MRSPVPTLVVALLLSVPATHVLAQEDGTDSEAGTEADRESRIHFEAGRAHYERGDYESAAREFETGHARQPLSAFLFNLYLTYERMGDFGTAADRLQAYLDAEPNVEGRGTLEARLENLRRRAANRGTETETETDTGTETETDTGTETETDTGTDTGTRTETGTGGGADFTVPAIIGLSVGGLGLAAFGIFAALASAEDGRLEEDCYTRFGLGGGYCTDDEVGAARTYALVADIGLGVGIAGVVAGVVLLLLSGDGDPDDATARFAPVVGPRTLGMAAEVDLR